jgi:mitochondrial splicing suppressor protein 51
LTSSWSSSSSSSLTDLAHRTAMASIPICSRCLRLTVSSATSTARRTAIPSASRRAFASTATQRSSRDDRKLHTTTRVGNPAVEAQQQRTTASVPPPQSSAAPSNAPAKDSKRVLLQPDNLFHSFTHSPSPEIRRRAQFMRQNAYCPHPDHQPTRAATSPHDAEAAKTGRMPPAHVKHECPDCGIPVYCCAEHFADDYAAHLEVCDILRQINEDDHDLVSGRFFPEFEYPGPQIEEAQINLTNWDTLLYSREFNAVNEDRSMRQVTRLLTYPITVGSVLHELSPYGLRNGLTTEGLRSLSGMSDGSSRCSGNCTLTHYSPPLHPPPTSHGCRHNHRRPSP